MQVVALHADATYTVHFGDGTNLTGVREACFAAAPAAAKAPTVLAATPPAALGLPPAVLPPGGGGDLWSRARFRSLAYTSCRLASPRMQLADARSMITDHEGFQIALPLASQFVCSENLPKDWKVH